MKKVRFETPNKSCIKSKRMSDNECHSPRPFIGRQVHTDAPTIYEYPKLITYDSDPVHRFECSNSSPYPITNKTSLPSFEKKSPWLPSNDLELSMLDSSYHEPRKPIYMRSVSKASNIRNVDTNEQPLFHQNVYPKVLSSIENKSHTPPNVLNKSNDFFIRRDNIDKLHFDVNPIQISPQNYTKHKENNPVAKKAEMMKSAFTVDSPEVFTNHLQPEVSDSPVLNNNCECHHCVKSVKNVPLYSNIRQGYIPIQMVSNTVKPRCNLYNCMTPPWQNSCSHCKCHISPAKQHSSEPYSCNILQNSEPTPLNAVDKKTWAVQKYEDSKKSECMEVEKQTNVSKEKREPTVSDLFKIIKLQNEQLQLLQEKVDKFISASKQEQNKPIQDYTNHVIQTVNNEQISIGVMTSFEMVRTSTIINKEVVKTNDNAQIQSNRSQISIQEVVSKTQPVNFLDGIKKISQDGPDKHVKAAPMDIMYDEKTLNEQSLYNVQVDNATTPMMSPEQSLYLDVRDYSDSEPGSDPSNVGWTYYNKVMTHVNGVLEDSDMPSSASALYRNTRQQCVQMQIDKTNVSVTKRVKFGDDPLGIHQPHIYAASTDTSLKMNQLAAKYLKNGTTTVLSHQPAPKPSSALIDMSFATRNYMERHKLLQVGQQSSGSPPPGELPRFLDITALKKQPKLL